MGEREVQICVGQIPRDIIHLFPFVFLSFDGIRPGVKNASTRNRSIDSSNNLFLSFFLIYFPS